MSKSAISYKEREVKLPPTTKKLPPNHDCPSCGHTTFFPNYTCDICFSQIVFIEDEPHIILD